MAITVNTNVSSLNAQRNLNKSGISLAKSLERLSSGLRINRAADDAAGLAISEGLRSQVRGLNQAVRNANDGISVLGTAEGSLDEATSLLQRVRELAVQAASDTNSASNRASLQAEIDQSINELTRIGTTVQFNGLSLLDGSFVNQKIQVGAFQNQSISLSIADVRATSLGQVATTTSTAIADSLTAGELQLNGIAVGATSADGFSTENTNASAMAAATAINAISGESGVTAEINATEVTADTGGGIVAMALDGDAGSGDALLVNGVNIGAVTVTDDDGSGALVAAINAITSQTGVEASLNASDELVLTAEDGRNVAVQSTGSVGGAMGFTANTSTNLAGTGANNTGTTGVFSGTVTMYSSQPLSIAGTNPADAGFTAVSIGLDSSTSITSINVTTSAGAANAIRTVDFALSQVTEVRAELGALTNRLESTIRNLQTVSQNLAASESRVRDADFAQESAAMVRAQILQQAGVAILAQANLVPQAALSLLG